MLPNVEKPTPGGRREGAGRPRQHGLEARRAVLRSLTTDRIDGRTKLAAAVRAFKAEIRLDLGGDLTRAQETILELVAQTWIQVSSLDAWLAQQPSLVLARKRTVLPILMQRATLAESLAKNLERLGLERRAKNTDLAAQLAALHRSAAPSSPHTQQSESDRPDRPERFESIAGQGEEPGR